MTHELHAVILYQFTYPFVNLLLSLVSLEEDKKYASKKRAIEELSRRSEASFNVLDSCGIQTDC